MTETEATAFLDPYIQLVRSGSFTTVFRKKTARRLLEEVARRDDYLAAQSAAILAETMDQLGNYKGACTFANADIGKRQLLQLEREISRNKPGRAVVRAHAWLLLQCAVSEFRREGGHHDGLELLNKGIDLISANSGSAIDSQHIQSLFYFWRARILSTASFDFRHADDDFENALRVADETLADKLKEADEDEKKPEKSRQRNRPAELVAGTYVLSTILSFGLAHARQMESRLLDSLWFLRAAVPLSRASQDFHRRGFVHLLMGTVLRGIARMGQLNEAVKQLNIAKDLIEKPDPHLLHRARIYHQLALSRYNDIPPGVARSKEHRQLLAEALADNKRAAEWSGDSSYKDFRDPFLIYGIKVADSLMQTALGDFDTAYKLADDAIRTIGHNVPRGTQGWALVAKGIACAELVEHAGQVAAIQKAENALLIVADDADLRQTDQAAAHLHLSRFYSKIAQPFKAYIHYQRAEPLVAASEHGWLKDLQAVASAALKRESGPELRLNVEGLLQEANEKRQGAWAYINRYLETDIKKRILALGAHQEILKGPDGEAKLAEKLGLTRATVFNWKKDAELKASFPSPGQRKRKRAPRSRPQ